MPSALERYRDAFEKGIPQELGIPPPTEEEMKTNTAVICRLGSAAIKVYGTVDKVSGKYFIDYFNQLGSNRHDAGVLARRVEDILTRHGAIFLDECAP